jgi:predicted nucleotidyltransferase
MDMSLPITTVIPTLDGLVLTVLARTTKPLTGRRVHQLASAGSETGTRKVLHRLAATGLVIADQVGGSIQFSLNREHLAARPVLELTGLRQELFDRIGTAIKNWAVLPIHAGIFGSTARGDGDLDSDVDLLLVHQFDDPPPQWSDQVSELAERVHAWTGNHLQTYALGKADLTRHFAAAEPIVNDWLTDSIAVYGPPFRQLRNDIVHGGQQ